MRIARIWKKPPSLFYPGWVAAIVGGSILILLLLFVFSMPWFASPTHVDAAELPINPRQATTPANGDIGIDLLADGTAIMEGWSPGKPCRIHIHKDARWVAIRSLFRRLHADGVYLVSIAVRNRDGSTATLRFDLQGPWPELDVNASAQDFVNAIQ